MIHAKLFAAVGAASVSVTIALQQAAATVAPTSTLNNIIGSVEQGLFTAGLAVGITYFALKSRGEQNARDIAATNENVASLVVELRGQAEWLTKVRIDIATLISASKNIGERTEWQVDSFRGPVGDRLTTALDQIETMRDEVSQLHAQSKLAKR